MNRLFSQPFRLTGIVMACGMPEVLGDRCGDQGAALPLLHTFNGAGQPAKPRGRSGRRRLSGLNSDLQRLIINDQASGIGNSCVALLQQAGMGGHQAATAADQNRLK